MEISAVISMSEFQNLNERIDWELLEGRKVLITGATGMVGSWLTTAILMGAQSGKISEIQVDALVHSGNITNLRAFRENKNLQLINSEKLFQNKSQDYDLVIHAASPASPQFFRNRDTLFNINVGFLQKLVEYSKSIPEVIYFSTGEVYGAGHTEKVSEVSDCRINLELERSMYPLAKLEAEKFLIKISTEENFKFSIFRLFHTFGPGMRIGDGRSFADFIWDGALHKKPRLYSLGTQIRSFLYLEDMVAAVLGIKRDNSIMNLGSEFPVSIKEFASIVSEESGLSGELDYSKDNSKFHASPNDLLLPDITLIKSKGWNQKIPVRTGISRSIEWARR